MSWLASLKTKLVALGVGALAFLGMLLRMRSLKDARDKARRERDRKVAEVEQAKKVQAADATIDHEHAEARRKAEAEKRAGKDIHNLGAGSDDW